MDKFGFPKMHLSSKTKFGFKTGDIVKAQTFKGNHIGKHLGRIIVAAEGYFALVTPSKRVSVSYRNCKLVQKADGYGYSFEKQNRRLSNQSPVLISAS